MIRYRKTICGILIIAILVMVFPIAVYAVDENNITIIGSSGYFESAYVKWTGGDGLGNTNVYWKKSGSANYTKIDPELIREYPNYFRADVPGLAAGEYVLKIVPVIGGVENESGAVETGTLNVSAYTREGFAFSSQSPVGTTNGG